MKKRLLVLQFYTSRCSENRTGFSSVVRLATRILQELVLYYVKPMSRMYYTKQLRRCCAELILRLMGKKCGILGSLDFEVAYMKK